MHFINVYFENNLVQRKGQKIKRSFLYAGTTKSKNILIEEHNCGSLSMFPFQVDIVYKQEKNLIISTASGSGNNRFIFARDDGGKYGVMTIGIQKVSYSPYGCSRKRIRVIVLKEKHRFAPNDVQRWKLNSVLF